MRLRLLLVNKDEHVYIYFYISIYDLHRRNETMFNTGSFGNISRSEIRIINQSVRKDLHAVRVFAELTVSRYDLLCLGYTID
jgi:hypothetical protein